MATDFTILTHHGYAAEVARLKGDQIILDMASCLDTANLPDMESWSFIRRAADYYVSQGGQPGSIGGPAAAIREIIAAEQVAA